MVVVLLNHRVIPTLLLDGERLVKTRRYARPKYVGDPRNAVRVFNEKEVDELLLVDISASAKGRSPSTGLIREIVSEAFMPVTYGGGVASMEDYDRLFNVGVEKVLTTTAALSNPHLLSTASQTYGSQSVVGGVDIVSGRLRRRRAVYDHVRRRRLAEDPFAYADRLVAAGVGEIVVSFVDREGMRTGLDLDFVQRLVRQTPVPVVAHGGVGDVDDIVEGFRAGAAAVACGTLFTLREPHNAVLISYLSPSQRRRLAAV